MKIKVRYGNKRYWCDDDTTTGSTSVYNYCPNCGAKMDGGKDEI